MNVQVNTQESRKRQIKLLILCSSGILAAAVILYLMYERNKTPSYEANYKSKIDTGVESLSDRELWIEKSTNEFSELKAKNELLGKQLDSMQKVILHMAKYMNILDDSKEGETQDLSSINMEATQQSKEQTNTEVNITSFNGMEDFVKGVKESERSLSESSVNNLQKKEEKLSTAVFNLKEEAPDENFIFAATYARCILVGSVTVNAGVGASSNPQPVLMRITDFGNLPNHIKGFLKDAMVIGAAYGELSSESVIIRLERIVKIDKNKEIGIDIPVQGYVAGENGDSRVRGIVIDRAGAVVRTAAVGGFLSGMAEFFTANNGSSAVKFEPNSGLAQFSPEKGSKMLEHGASKGIGNAVEKYADFYIKRAEQLQPVIKIDGGRKLTVVFTQSVKASSIHMKKVRRNLND